MWENFVNAVNGLCFEIHEVVEPMIKALPPWLQPIAGFIGFFIMGMIFYILPISLIMVIVIKIGQYFCKKPAPRPSTTLVTLPPQPSVEKLLAEAEQRYVGKLAWLEKAGLEGEELKSAREETQQRYLREIDGLL